MRGMTFDRVEYILVDQFIIITVYVVEGGCKKKTVVSR